MSAAASATLAEGGAQFGCSEATVAISSSGRDPRASPRTRSNSVTTRSGDSSRMAHETPSRTRAAATMATVSDADTIVGGRRCMPPRVASRPSNERLLM
jgi:hypothetical protein